jgi:hypothetical protein
MTKNNDAAVTAVRSLSNVKENSFTLSTNITMRPLRVPNLLFAEVVSKFKAPKVPRYHNPDTDRDEDNPNDPAYIDAFNEYQAGLSMAIIDAMVLMGTEVVTVPRGTERPEDELWTRKLKMLGVSITDDPLSRYLAWVKYYAAEDQSDIQMIMNAVGRMSGVSEEDVNDAISQFRNSP